jgi:Tfp pilus assembly protein PilO|tara:strand:+ start:1411 stop:1617 length:207 start_codon:yes stop_codon:yes gene_type:complete
MNIDIKILAPYLIMALGFAMTWGMWAERLDALETKTDKITEMKQDIAIIKEKIIWMEEYLIKTREVSF